MPVNSRDLLARLLDPLARWVERLRSGEPMIWDVAPVRTLIVVTAIVFVGLGIISDAFGLPLGTDARLWGLNALNLRVGATPIVTPLYPALLAVFGWLPLKVYDLAQLINGIATILLPAGVYAVAVHLGAERRRALLAAAITLLEVRILIFGYHTQPDTLSVWMLLLSAPLLAWHRAAPTPRRWAALGLFLGAAYMLREHGLLLAMGVAGVWFISPGTWRQRLIGPALVLAVILLAPMLVLQPPGPPWDMPWFARVAMAGKGQENLRIDIYKFDAGLVARHIQAHTDDDWLGIRIHHVLNSLVKARGAWLVVVAAIIGFFEDKRAERLTLMVPVATALPALAILSQDRHVVVVVPVALAVLASVKANTALVRLTWWLAGLGCAVNLVLAGIPWREHVDQAEKRGLLKEQAAQFCDLVEPDDLLVGESTELQLHCPIRQTALPDGNSDATLWKAWLLQERAPSVAGWVPMGRVINQGNLYRYRPELRGEKRPCASSKPASNTPYVSVPPAVAELDPPCTDAPPPSPRGGGSTGKAGGGQATQR